MADESRTKSRPGQPSPGMNQGRSFVFFLHPRGVFVSLVEIFSRQEMSREPTAWNP